MCIRDSTHTHSITHSLTVVSTSECVEGRKIPPHFLVTGARIGCLNAILNLKSINGGECWITSQKCDTIPANGAETFGTTQRKMFFTKSALDKPWT